MEGVQTRVQQHITMYQAHRRELVDVYQQKLQELAAAKEEISQASQTLAAQPADVETTAILPEASVDLAGVQDMIRQAAQVEPIDIGSDPEKGDEDDMDATSPKSAELIEERPAKTSGVKLQAFRGTPSPTRVANLNLQRTTKT